MRASDTAVGLAVIATLKVLGLKARDSRAVAWAARRVADYVEGSGSATAIGSPDTVGKGGLAAYFAPGSASTGQGSPVQCAERRRAHGRSGGSGAALVGLHGPVNGEQLQRLLTGPAHHYRSAAVGWRRLGWSSAPPRAPFLVDRRRPAIPR